MDISQRTLEDMKSVALEPAAIRNGGMAYVVERNLEIINKRIRYDITAIPAENIGREFAKTFGHYHKDDSPELYEVLNGRAYFLLQKHDGDPGAIKEAYVVEASAGEKAVMPPGFGHLSINVGNEKLVMGNWIGLTEYDYDTIKKLRGGCYYVLDAGAEIEFEKNHNYKSVPDLKKLKLRDLPDLGIINSKNHPILDLKKSPEKLDWLVNPIKYKELLTIKNLYREI